MTQNPATAKITYTDRRLLVADELPSERGAADKLGDTGQPRGLSRERCFRPDAPTVGSAGKVP
jgi:hypothetical protein